jgi:kinesin family protein 3/17
MIGKLDDENQRGIMPNSFQHLFTAIQSEAHKGKQFLIRCSFIEIYNEEIRDLLSMNEPALLSIDMDGGQKKKLEIKENQD